MSLRKATNVRVEQGGIFFIHRKFYITKKRYFKFESHEYKQLEKDLETNAATVIGSDRGRALWWTKGGFYWTEKGLKAEEVDLLVWDAKQKKKAKFDQLRELREGKKSPPNSRRKSIPTNVKSAVWKRDGERCVQCGSKEEIQFDHIIPVAKGGASTLENLQILCGHCNRRKSVSIA